MRRIIIQGLLACLLALFPVMTLAQTLTRYEYWFDDDFASRQSSSLSGSYKVLRLSIDTYFMPLGVHKFSFRVRQSDGHYSAISSSLFLKRMTAESTALEYWFDDNFDQRESRSISDGPEEQQLTLDLRNNTLYPPGFHRLKMRVTVAGQGVSSVCSSGVLKIAAGRVSSLEYWVDNDYTSVRTLSAQTIDSGYVFTSDLDLSNVAPGFHSLSMRARSSSGRTASAVTTSNFLKLCGGMLTGLEYWIDDDLENAQIISAGPIHDEYCFINELDMSKVAPGYHVLNMRARNNSGRTMGAITSAGFIKLTSGPASKLEYWIDDRSSVHTLSGEAISDGYIFMSNLNLGNLAPGQHRLYYRPRGVNSKTAGAVSMVPVIVKLDYGPCNDDYSQPVTNAKVTDYSVAVDNQTPNFYKVLNPKYEVTQPHVLDASNLTAGNHTVKLKFWNSLHAGVSTEKTFKVVIPEPPTVTLTAQQQGGLVKLQFNSVPNDIVYGIRCVDANGALRNGYNVKHSLYPEPYTFTDNPPAGTYRYYIIARYRDWTGSEKNVFSNEVTVTVAQAQTEEEAAEQYGTITGKIVCDKNTPTSGLSVKFSDGQTVPVQGTVFSRTHVEKGKQLTMTVLGDNTHTYKSDPLTVKAGNNDVVITGTYKEEFQPDNLANDLEIDRMELTSKQSGLHLRLHLKNRYQDRPWRGMIRVKALDKKKADKMDGYIEEMSLNTLNMHVGIANDFSISGGDAKYVELDMQSLVEDKSTDYYFYFESIGKYDGTYQGNITKPMAANSYSEVNCNPVVRTIVPPPAPQVQFTKWDDKAKDTFAYLMLGAASVTPGAEGLLGNMDEFTREVMIATGTASPEAAAQAIGNWFAGKNGLQAINDANLKMVADAAKTVFEKARKEVKKRIVKKFWTTLATVVGDEVNDARPFIEFIIDAVKVSKKSTFDQCMTCMSVLYGALASGPASVSGDMKALMVVGQSLINEAIAIAEVQNSKFIANRLVANRVNTNSSDSRTNTAVDFKLIVKNKKKKGKPIDFTKKSNNEQIDYITVNLAKSPTSDATVFSFNLKYYEDSLMLETVQTDQIGYTGANLYGFDVAHALYMEIHWSNGRITQVPLLKSCDGIEIKTDGVTMDVYTDDNFMAQPPVVYTVTLTTATGEDNMADDIYLGNNDKRQ